jgi:tetratricopeptide (TPR) repeat protein
MKFRNRLVFSVRLALLASTCLGAPSWAKTGGTAALSAKITGLSRAGKYAEAAALAQGQVENLEKKFGPNNRDVGAALNNLAQVYRSQGRDGEAEPLLKRAIAILEKTVGLDSPEIAAALSNLAALYQRQDRLADAEPLFKRALAIRE